MASTVCGRCLADAIQLDPEDGVLVCFNCGNVVDEHELVDQPYVEQLAYDDTDRGGYAGKAYDPEKHLAKKVRADCDALKALASMFRLPETTLEEGRWLIQRARTERFNAGGTSATTEANMAAFLYLAARNDKQALTLNDVARQTGQDVKAIALVAKKLTSVLGLTPPRPSIRGLLIRTVVDVLQAADFPSLKQQQQAAATAGGVTGSGGDGDAQQQPRHHPLMKAANTVMDIIAKLGAHEGRQPRTVTATVLSLALDMLHNHDVPLDDLAAHCHVSDAALREGRRAMTGQLLEAARLLPFGAAVTARNVMDYLPVLSAFCDTLKCIRQRNSQQQPAPAAVVAAAAHIADHQPALAAPEQRPLRKRARGSSGTLTGGSALQHHTSGGGTGGKNADDDGDEDDALDSEDEPVPASCHTSSLDVGGSPAEAKMRRHASRYQQEQHQQQQQTRAHLRQTVLSIATAGRHQGVANRDDGRASQQRICGSRANGMDDARGDYG